MEKGRSSRKYLDHIALNCLDCNRLSDSISTADVYGLCASRH